MKNIRISAFAVLCAVLLGSTAHTAALSLPAEDSVAEDLHSIGILRGDGTSFNLGEVPDRLQAAVMVVRMRGEEEEALAAYESGELTCPFTDVTENWAKPYLAWLADKGLIAGTGDGNFSNGPCDAQMYATMMLRALGYQADEGGSAADFLYTNALSFALEKKIINSSLTADTFDRGTMASITYLTLAAETKETGEILLDTLVDSGAINAGAAKQILQDLRGDDIIDFNGAEIRLLTTAGDDRANELRGDAEGDTIDLAVFRRNIKTEEQYNIRLSVLEETEENIRKQIQMTVLAADPVYDAVLSGAQNTINLAVFGMLSDMTQLEGLDLSNPWWDSHVNEEMRLGTKQLFAAGDLTLADNRAENIMFYNRTLLNTYGLADPAALVSDGAWTFTSLYTMLMSADGKTQNLLLSNNRLQQNLNNAAGMSFVEKDTDGMLTMTLHSEETMQMGDFVNTIVNGVTGIQKYDDLSAMHSAFAAGDSLFMMDALSALETIAGSGIDYGVLPLPKADEAQERYYNSLDLDTMQVLSVPQTQLYSSIGYVLETMAQESSVVTDAYLDMYAAADDDRRTMLELILNTARFDFGDADVNGMSDLLDALNAGSGNMAAVIAQNKVLIEKNLQKLNNAIAQLP